MKYLPLPIPLPGPLPVLTMQPQAIPTPQPKQPTMHLAGIPVYEVEGMKGFAIAHPQQPK